MDKKEQPIRLKGVENLVNVAELRAKNKKMTQVELAEEIGVSVTAIKSWEKDIFSIGSVNLKKLSNYFEVSTDELLGINKRRD